MTKQFEFYYKKLHDFNTSKCHEELKKTEKQYEAKIKALSGSYGQ